MTVEVCVPIQTQLGEGPMWDERQQCLYWVDILGETLNRYDPRSGQNEVFPVGQPVGTIVLCQSPHEVMLAVRDGFAVYHLETQQLTLLHNPEPHLPDNRFNDGKCDPAGRFWAGTMAFSGRSKVGSLYCLYPDMTTRKVLTDITISNGLVWTQDHKTMYYIDSVPGTVTAYDYDIETGHIQNGRVAIQVPRDMGFPDGMCLDSDGKLWIAHYNNGCVRRWDPETAAVLYTIPLPATKVTACTFGGEQLNTLYITTATDGLTPTQQAAQPQAGYLFAIDLPYTGLPAFRFNRLPKF